MQLFYEVSREKYYSDASHIVANGIAIVLSEIYKQTGDSSAYVDSNLEGV